MTTTPTPATARPRIRAGAVLYGLVLAAASIGLLVVSADPVLRAQVVERGITLEPGAALALAVAALGAMALLLALARLLDRRTARDDG
ncbi:MULTISPECIES: hypothetical protein [unclassified Rathayibacter]|jgi:hypothetical protein|uniref:hypothetical protein n=1 Tax=unclassified Rathayibacter TaxID=2609250 RepID=UPI000CE77ECB|nr:MULTISPECIES: hypothetical protein [unclassified Rathayibacter]PPI26512.1 hypothetical protein C5D44_07205 [Rathayibacter sp. AY1B5]PPI29852.1 hypothetical protein C5D34_13605 [Rathayibacter sp. AY1B1]